MKIKIAIALLSILAVTSVFASNTKKNSGYSNGAVQELNRANYEAATNPSGNPYSEMGSKEAVLITTEDFESATVENKAYVSKVQIYLNMLGYKAGLVSGEVTEKTQLAIKAFQKDRNSPEDGEINSQLYQRLKEDAGAYYKAL